MLRVSFSLRKLNIKTFDMTNCHGKFHARAITTVADYPVPEITPSVIKDKLKKASYSFVDGHTSFQLSECTMCSPLKKRTGSGKGADLFINKRTGYFVCDLCKCAGTWDVFDRLLSRNLKEGEKTAKEVAALRDGCTSYYEKGQLSWKKIAEENILLHELPDDEYKQVFISLVLSMCEKTVAEKLNLYVSSDRKTLYLPISSTTQLILGYIMYSGLEQTAVVPKKNCAGFLIYGTKRKQTSAVIVTTITDFFALVSKQLSKHIIYLPYGISNLPQISLPILEPFEHLTLWFAPVQGAWAASRNFAKKLNEKRCSIIKKSELYTSPVDAVANNLDIKNIISEAQPTWHQSITTFASLRVDVLQELRNHEEVLGVKWKRFPTLNKTLRGHRRGELTVITGPTGSGKTTFMSEYSLDLACQGVNTLWGSFEVRNVRLARTMLQQFVSRPLDAHLSEFDKVADEFERLPIYFLTFHGQENIKTVMDAVQHAAYIHDIGHVIIDNVQFMIGMTEDSKYTDRYHKQDMIIHNFRTFATRSNCHVSLVIHPRKERESEDLTVTSIFGGAKAAQEADNVLIIQDKRLSSTKGRKYLQVAKNRYTGDLGIMLLEFDKDSLSFSQKKRRQSDESKIAGPEFSTVTVAKHLLAN